MLDPEGPLGHWGRSSSHQQGTVTGFLTRRGSSVGGTKSYKTFDWAAPLFLLTLAPLSLTLAHRISSPL